MAIAFLIQKHKKLQDQQIDFIKLKIHADSMSKKLELYKSMGLAGLDQSAFMGNLQFLNFRS